MKKLKCFWNHLNWFVANPAGDFFEGIGDSIGAWLEQLTRVEALALLILTSFDVFTRCLSKGKLAFGVDVQLGNTHGDCLLNLFLRDTRTAVKNERHLNSVVQFLQTIEVQALPVVWILTVDVADTSSQEVDPGSG